MDKKHEDKICPQCGKTVITDGKEKCYKCTGTAVTSDKLNRKIRDRNTKFK